MVGLTASLKADKLQTIPVQVIPPTLFMNMRYIQSTNYTSV